MKNDGTDVGTVPHMYALDAALWVRHSVLAQKPSFIPGDSLNGKNLFA